MRRLDTETWTGQPALTRTHQPIVQKGIATCPFARQAWRGLGKIEWTFESVLKRRQAAASKVSEQPPQGWAGPEDQKVSQAASGRSGRVGAATSWPAARR